MAEREQYIRMLIAEKGMTLKEFSQKIGMKYTTLTTILNGSIGKASLENVYKICEGLEITTAQLQKNKLHDDALERELIKTFRELNDIYKKILIEQAKVLKNNQK